MKILSQSNYNYTARVNNANNPNFKMIEWRGDKNAILKDIERKSTTPHSKELLEEFIEKFKQVPGIKYVFYEYTIAKNPHGYNYSTPGQFFRPRIELDKDVKKVLNNSRAVNIYAASGYYNLVEALPDSCDKTKLKIIVQLYGWLSDPSFSLGNTEEVKKYADKINNAPNEYLKLAEFAELLQNIVKQETEPQQDAQYLEVAKESIQKEAKIARYISQRHSDQYNYSVEDLSNDAFEILKEFGKLDKSMTKSDFNAFIKNDENYQKLMKEINSDQAKENVKTKKDICENLSVILTNLYRI